MEHKAGESQTMADNGGRDRQQKLPAHSALGSRLWALNSQFSDVWHHRHNACYTLATHETCSLADGYMRVSIKGFSGFLAEASPHTMQKVATIQEQKSLLLP